MTKASSVMVETPVYYKPWDPSPAMEPDSPVTPIKKLVRKHSKDRPAGKMVHQLNAVKPPSKALGYSAPLPKASAPTSMPKPNLLLPAPDLMNAPRLGSSQGARALAPGELDRMNRDATSWFRNVRKINSEASSVETAPKIVRRRSSSVPELWADNRPGTAPGFGIGSLPCKSVDLNLEKLFAKKLSPEEREQLFTVFKQYDADNSGSIDLEELTKMCTDLGGRITRAEARMLMEQLDKDKSGAIDFEEFVLFWTTQPSLGKYRSIQTSEKPNGMQALMSGLLKTTSVAIAKNTLLSRLNKPKDGLRRRNTVE